MKSLTKRNLVFISTCKNLPLLHNFRKKNRSMKEEDEKHREKGIEYSRAFSYLRIRENNASRTWYSGSQMSICLLYSNKYNVYSMKSEHVFIKTKSKVAMDLGQGHHWYHRASIFFLYTIKWKAIEDLIILPLLYMRPY